MKTEPKKRGRKPKKAKPETKTARKSERDTSVKKRCATYLNTAHVTVLEREFKNVYQALRVLTARFVKSKEKKMKA